MPKEVRYSPAPRLLDNRYSA